MIVAAIIAIAILLGVSIISFSDFGENISAPIEETGKTFEKIGLSIGIPLILLIGYLIWRES